MEALKANKIIGNQNDGRAVFFFPPNFWVVSIRILNGVAGHGRCRSVGRSVGRSVA